MLQAQLNGHIMSHHKSALALGFSQFTVNVCFALLFYTGFKIYINNIFTVAIEDVLIAIFAMMFGAFQAGEATQFGPDLGKAGAAAKRIFSIIEDPSLIDA